MTLARSIKRRVRAGIPAVIFLSLVAYFAWNATRGDLGLHAYARRQQDLMAADASLSDALAERDEWKHKVTALQPAHLDSDALDERARQLLNLAGPDDVVIPAKN